MTHVSTTGINNRTPFPSEKNEPTERFY